LDLSINGDDRIEALPLASGRKRSPSIQRSQSRNLDLNHAYLNKKDEFYTHHEDIANEMLGHRAELRGKVVLCNCDDPFESEFFRFFALNFTDLELRALVATCYSPSPAVGRLRPIAGVSGAYKATITQVPDHGILRSDGSIDIDRLLKSPGNSIVYLKGNGDFRSAECVSILKDADIVATNPPFSLFREYIALLEHHETQFVILGNMNAATYREVFPLFRDNKLWYGESIRSGDRKFYVPDSYPLNAAGCGIDNTGRPFIRVKGVRWFTNLSIQRRREAILLTKRYTSSDFPKYENYDAIEVGRTENIPNDYFGVMGVPITFLDKYCPDQFQIIMLANGNARTNVSSGTLGEVGYRPHRDDKGGVGIINGRRAYARILIRRKSS
jgi:hypothetical protein